MSRLSGHVCMWRDHCKSPSCPWLRCGGCGTNRRRKPVPPAT